MSGHWLLDFFDRKKPFYVLFQYSTEGIAARVRYHALQCSQCGRFETLKALRKGIDPTVSVPKGLSEMIETDDGLVVVNSRTRAIIESLAPDAAWYFGIPSAPEYWVIYPKTRFVPPNDTKFYGAMAAAKPGDVFQIRKRPCTKCTRPQEVTCKADWFVVPRPVDIAIIVFDGVKRERSRIVVNDDLHSKLQLETVTGWRATRTATVPIRAPAQPKKVAASNLKSASAKRRKASVTAKLKPKSSQRKRASM